MMWLGKVLVINRTLALVKSHRSSSGFNDFFMEKRHGQTIVRNPTVIAGHE